MERKIRWIWWGVLLLLIIAAAWRLFLPHGNKAYLNTESSALAQTTTARELVVYVSGAVAHPGLIHLPLDARMDDAVKQAVPLPEADLEVMNLAEKIKDGRKIVVPYRPLPEVIEDTQGAGDTDASAGGAAAGSVVTSSSGQGSASSASSRININRAGSTELEGLPGIGPALAQRIVQYREENGAFISPEDLQKVSGIGPKIYAKMADRVTVGP